MLRHGRSLMEGLDGVTLEASTGRIARVDGCFGHPTLVVSARSGIPEALRRTTEVLTR